MPIPVQVVVDSLEQALDAEGQGKYYDFDRDFKPAINRALNFLVSTVNLTVENKKFGEEILRELTKVRIFQPNTFSRISFNPSQLGHELWTIQGVYPKPTVTPSTVTPGVSATNLFTDGDNGTMESNITGLSSDGTLVQAATEVFEGLKSAKYTKTNIDDINDVILKSDNGVILKQGKSYLMRAEIFVDASSPISNNDEGGNIYTNADNGSMENNINGITSDGTLVQSTTQAFEGTKSAKYTKTRDGDFGDRIISDQIGIALKKDRTYKVRARIFVDSSSPIANTSNDVVVSLPGRQRFLTSFEFTKTWNADTNPKDEFIEIETEVTPFVDKTFFFAVQEIRTNPNQKFAFDTGAIVFVDKFEVRELLTVIVDPALVGIEFTLPDQTQFDDAKLSVVKKWDPASNQSGSFFRLETEIIPKKDRAFNPIIKEEFVFDIGAIVHIDKIEVIEKLALFPEESTLVDNASFVRSDHSAKRLTFEEWNQNRNNPFEAGNIINQNCADLLSFAYLNFADYTSTNYNLTVPSEIEIRPDVSSDFVAVVYIKVPDQVTSETDDLEFPPSFLNPLVDMTLVFIAYKQGDNTTLFQLADQKLKEFLQTIL